MKALVQMIVLLVVVGCASPYRTVYTSSEGDYYIEERSQAGGYYLDNSILFAGIGFEPWWIVTYSPDTFVYYDPYYYLYYLTAWYPWGYQPNDGYLGWHDPYWCPPFRMRRIYAPTNRSDFIDDDPVTAPQPGIIGANDSHHSWKAKHGRSQRKALEYSGDAKYRGYDSTRPKTPGKSMLPPTRIAPRPDYLAAGSGSAPGISATGNEARATYLPRAGGVTSSPSISTTSAASISSGTRTSGTRSARDKQ